MPLCLTSYVVSTTCMSLYQDFVPFQYKSHGLLFSHRQMDCFIQSLLFTNWCTIEML